MAQNQRTVLDIVRRYLTIALLVFIFLELIFHPSKENLFGCLAEFYGWLLISQTVLKMEYMQKYMIPFIALFSYGVCFFVLPIPATLIEGKPLCFRFNVPYLTFFNLMLNATTIVAAFHVCRIIYCEGWLTNLWRSLGYFTPPSGKAVWALGLMGFFALLWNVSIQGTEEMKAENLGAIGQFLNVLRLFAYVPVVFLFPQYWGSNKSYAGSKKVVIVYLVILSIVAIASTKRTILVNMVFVWVVMSVLAILYENKNLFTNRNIALLLVGLYLITGPVADLAIAMIVSRSSIYNSSSSSTFSNVIKLYGDKEQLHILYQLGTFSNSDNSGDNFNQWSEYYIDNIFLDRFCNLRTQDITLDYAKNLGYGSQRMKEYASNFIVFQIPTPILNYFGYQGNKFDHNYTPGDLLSSDALGLKYQYKGFRVAGDSAVGLAWMGYSYYLFAFILYIILFYFLSSIVSFKHGVLLVPIPVITGLTFYTTYFNNATGIFRTISFLVRTGWQNILIYCIIMWGLRKLFK
jgi:hypothetical protein